MINIHDIFGIFVFSIFFFVLMLHSLKGKVLSKSGVSIFRSETIKFRHSKNNLLIGDETTGTTQKRYTSFSHTHLSLVNRAFLSTLPKQSMSSSTHSTTSSTESKSSISTNPQTSIVYGRAHLSKFVDILRNEESAVDIVVLDVSNKVTWSNYFVMVGGRSTRHIKAMAERMLEIVKPNVLNNNSVYGSVEGENSTDWMIVDAGNIVFQFFTKEGRAYYDLEKQWALRTAQSQEEEEFINSQKANN